MREYMLVCRGSHKNWAALSKADWDDLLAKFEAWTQPLKDRNLYVKGTSLSEESRIVMRRSARTSVAEGSVDEDERALTGFFVVKAECLDHAAELAKGCPSLLHDKIEIYETGN